MNRGLVQQLLILHEDLRLKPYHDSKGILTIGVGHNLESNGLSHAAVMFVLDEDIDEVIKQVSQFSWFESLSDTRQAAICDMVFNLGINRFKGFKKLIAALEAGDFDGAAREMMDSAWAIQVGERAHTLSQMIKTDESI